MKSINILLMLIDNIKHYIYCIFQTNTIVYVFIFGVTMPLLKNRVHDYSKKHRFIIHYVSR